MRSIKFIGSIALAFFIAGFATTVFALTCPGGNADCAGIACLTGICNTATGNCVENCAACQQCNSSSGVCDINSPNGTLCNADNNKCTGSPNSTVINDSCTNGVCVAGPLKNCDLGNFCKIYGTCSTSTGNCPVATNKSNGTVCDDNNACTSNDACATGACKGIAKNCSDNNVCTIDTCDTATGACSNTTTGTSFCGSVCPNPLLNGTILSLATGMGSTLNVPCSVGSCFAMDQGPGAVTWTDVAPGTDTGLVIGKAQLSGGQEAVGGGTITTPGQVTAAWNFFLSWGTFYTAPSSTTNIYCGTPCQGADCIFKTELNVFNVAWNGNIIPMGSAAGCTNANCSDAQRNGIFISDWQINPVTGGAWSMNYSQVVPSGSFAGVKFTAVLRGTVTIPVTGLCDGVVCAALDQCHTVGICDLTTGICSNPMAPVGTACNDNNACTTGDACNASGVCVGTAVVCSPPATCLPATGFCGLCTTNADCTASDQCHVAGICDTATGACSNPNAADGIACNDGNVCMSGDFCSSGVCQPGTTINPNCVLTTPTLVYPLDGQTGLGTTLEFRWEKSTDPDNDPMKYKIHYCPDSTFTDPSCAPVTVASRSSKGMFYAGGAGLFMIGMTFFGGLRGKRRIVLLFMVLVLFAGGTIISCKAKDETELPANQMNYVATGLSANTTYYWKVTADNGKTGGLKESAVQSFTTE